MESNRIGDLFSFEDQYSKLIGALYLENKKLVFIENGALNKDEILKEKILAVKLKLNQINKDGYLKVLTLNKPTLSNDGKIVDSENHVFKATYIEDEDFLEKLKREIFYKYQVKIQLRDNIDHSTSKNPK